MRGALLLVALVALARCGSDGRPLSESEEPQRSITAVVEAAVSAAAASPSAQRGERDVAVHATGASDELGRALRLLSRLRPLTHAHKSLAGRTAAWQQRCAMQALAARGYFGATAPHAAFPHGLAADGAPAPSGAARGGEADCSGFMASPVADVAAALLSVGELDGALWWCDASTPAPAPAHTTPAGAPRCDCGCALVEARAWWGLGRSELAGAAVRRAEHACSNEPAATQRRNALMLAAVRTLVARSAPNAVASAVSAWHRYRRLLKPMWGMPAVTEFATRPLVVLTYLSGMDWQHFHIADVRGCAAPCLWVSGPTDHAPVSTYAADALVFDCLQTPPQGLARPRHQVWVLLCMESAAHIPRLKAPAFLSLFDVTATYRRDSDVPLLYAPGNATLWLKRWPAPTKFAVWVASNCAPARLAIVEALARRVAVDSFGQCSHSVPWPDDVPPVWGSEKIGLLARYKFTVAFENSFEEDYVTEKFYQPLLAGSVPIYFGAPNVLAFAPHPAAYIDATAFETIDDLAAHLAYLDRNATALAEHTRWREAWLSSGVAQLESVRALAFNTNDVYGERDMQQNPCRLCSRVAEAQRLRSRQP